MLTRLRAITTAVRTPASSLRTAMADEDLSSLGFTSFGKTAKSHRAPPMHANPTPLPQMASSSLPQRPPPTQHHHHQQQQQQFQHSPNYGGRGGGYRGGYRGGFDNRGGPHRRGFNNNRGRGRGGRGHHHHPYANPPQQFREFSGTAGPQAPPYRSAVFGEGLYKNSMNEDPWERLQVDAAGGDAAASSAPDVWLGANEPVDKSAWYDKPEDRAADGGGWNADEIDLGDDI
ncbi:hypothetical protein TWF696_004549 [Orbilia brochopaga]|uniref:Uncharacterized protein n=1 Tax=Orbilia brochopaga TaxID=3140254 RepID=A0AAV9V9T7_9PEZI